MHEINADESLVKRIELLNAVLLAVLVVGAWVFFAWEMASGVLLGGVVSILSFRILKWQLNKAFLDPKRPPGKGRLYASYYLRYLGVLFLVFVVIYYKWANPIAFLVGLSVVALSILVVGGQQYWVMLQRKGES
ncbi:MAG: ATP synthase subunit I [Syntrophobacteraceae bacterium]